MLKHPVVDYAKYLNRSGLAACLMLCSVATTMAADPTVKGTLRANGETVELPYVYMWPEKEGFYDAGDPTWNLLFVERPLEPREIGEHIWDAAWVHIGVTETKEFTGQPELQVYMQSIKLSADSGGNISGGNYPEIELEGFGTELISGRVWHVDTQEFFDDSYHYDFFFSTSISDPDAPIGDLLPDGGGEPGQAYLKWVETVHTGDIEKLKSIVPVEMAAQLDAVTPEEAQEEIEFMQLLTPKAVSILSGSSDGETALLQIEGMMEGEKVSGEITMTRMGDIWIPTNSSM